MSQIAREEFAKVRDEMLKAQRTCAWCYKKCENFTHLVIHIMLKHSKKRKNKMFRKHILEIKDKTAANLTLVTLKDDEFHQNIKRAAMSLYNEGIVCFNYQAQYTSGKTWWLSVNEKVSFIVDKNGVIVNSEVVD